MNYTYEFVYRLASIPPLTDCLASLMIPIYSDAPCCLLSAMTHVHSTVDVRPSNYFPNVLSRVMVVSCELCNGHFYAVLR